MSRPSSVTAVTQAKDETAGQRFFAQHRLAIISLLLGTLSALLFYIEKEVSALDPLGSWWDELAIIAVVIFILSFFIDPALAVWGRWGIVAADAGLLGRRGGVPARWFVFPGWRKVWLLTSRDSILSQDWDTAKIPLAQGLGYDRVLMKPAGKKLLLTFTNGRNLFDHDVKRPLSLKDEAVLVGVDETGKDFWLDTDGHSGMVVGGIPGSGKTVFLRRLAQTFATNPKNKVLIFDGKRSRDFLGDASENISVFSGSPDRDPAVLIALRGVEAELHTRTEMGVVPGRLVVIVDESQTYLDASGTSGDEKKALEEASRILKSLVALGRALGIFVVLSTQKPDAASMPTRLRDNAGLRACARLRTSDGVKMVLGEPNEVALHLLPGQMLIDSGRDTPTLVKVALEP